MRRAFISKCFTVLTVGLLLGTNLGSAYAAKSEYAVLSDASSSSPVGQTYLTAGGSYISAEVTGFDANGNVVCQTRAYGNQQSSTIPCPTSAARFSGAVRSNEANYCATVTNAWNGMIVACHAPIWGKGSSTGWATYDIGVWARGIGS